MGVESSFYGLRSAIKNFGIERFKKDLLREGVTERVESMKERGLHIKEEVTEKGEHMKEGVTHMKEGVTEKVEHMRERSREMKERAKETAGLTAKEVTERVKANATLHAAED